MCIHSTDEGGFYFEFLPSFLPLWLAQTGRPCLKSHVTSSSPPQVQNLSGGELQRVALTLCLGKPADVYLIDEPSAYLDSEQRLMAARVIKRSEVTSHLHLSSRRHRTLPHSLRVRPQVHPPRQEDGVRGGARLHHGDLPGRQSHRVRRYSLQEDRRQHVRRAHGAFILVFFSNTSWSHS